MLADKIAMHNANVWLLNTGWSGGAYGTGKRMKLGYTRAMVRAALDGSLATAEFHADPIFGLHLPKTVAGVPDDVLNPRVTWANGAEYDGQATKLAGMFRENIKKFGDAVSPAILAAGPKG
jgi:phosphoenolpyruvate carboxykinase (ATP)